MKEFKELSKRLEEAERKLHYSFVFGALIILIILLVIAVGVFAIGSKSDLLEIPETFSTTMNSY